MHSTEKKALALNLLLSLLMAAGYMLLFAYNSTPLGAAIGSDNAMYLTMGTALAKGWAPYVDVFDHKGPLLFALQGLPQWIGGGYNLTAVFLQEVVALFACLTVVRALARALSCPPVWAQLVYLAMTCAFMDGGNLTEEYTNLPTLLALYMALRVFGQEKIGEKLFLPAAGMGVCAAAAFSLRANNALPIFALVAVLAAGLAITQRFAQLGQCAAGFTLGLLAVFLPILIWLAAKGALSAAWYGAIIHNMMYADSGTGDRFAALFTTSYGHMAMIIAAFACTGAMAVVSALRQPRAQKAAALTLAAVSALWLGISGVSANAARLSEREGLAQFAADAQTLMAQVPEDERDSFMAYRVEPKWYVAAKALPCMRFYFLQEILAQADPAVMDEIVDTFETDPPRWLVLFYNRTFSPPYDERVAQIFETEYERVDTAGQYQLLRLKE